MRTILACPTIPVLCVLILMNALTGCESEDIAPFTGGDYFEYKQLTKDYAHRYQLERNDKETFTIAWQSGGSEPVELIIDHTGRIIETPQYQEGSLGRDLFHGRQISLWLPTGKRSVGERVYFADFIDTHVVTEEREWKKWNVWVTKHSNVFGWQENYYDKETGFLVGSQSAGGDVYLLDDSNLSVARQE